MSAPTRHAARRLAESLSRRLSLARAATSSDAADRAIHEAPRRRNGPANPRRREAEPAPLPSPSPPPDVVNRASHRRAWSGLTVGELRAQLAQRHGGWGGDEEDEDWYGDHPLDAVMERLAREIMGPDAKTVRVGDGVTVVMPGQIMNVIDGFGDGNGIQAASVKLKRKRKMAKHKHRKRRKRDRNKG